MRYSVPLTGFERQGVTLQVGFFGRSALLLGDEEIKPSNGIYILRSDIGREVVVRLHRKFLDPVPVVMAGMMKLNVIPELRWYDYVWISLPLLLAAAPLAIGTFVTLYDLAGYIGGFILGGTISYLSSRILRANVAPWGRYVLIGISSLIPVTLFVALSFIGNLIGRSSEEQARESAYRSALGAGNLSDMHGGKHKSAVDTTLLPEGTSIDPTGYPRLQINIAELRSMLKRREFTALNEKLLSYQLLFERDYHFELAVAQAYDALAVADSSLESRFNEWVAGFPDSAQPYVARGVYGKIMGWENRGYTWAKDTPPASFRKMEKYFSRAESDLLRALTIRPNVMVAYETLMDIARARGENSLCALILNVGLLRCPTVYRLRERYMMALLPRWGGSHEQMTGFAELSDRYVRLNPKLRTLRGFIPWDVGTLIERDSDNETKEELFTQALSYGEAAVFYDGRGSALYDLGKYDSARADYEKALALSPADGAILYREATALFNLGRTRESRILLDSALAMAPTIAKQIAKWRTYGAEKLVYAGYEYAKQNLHDKAIALFDSALAYNPIHAEAYYYRSSSYAKLQRWTEAVQDLRLAIGYDPHDLKSYILLDRVWSRSGEWSSIVDLWNRLLALEPENARAYMERGGAYYHQGDIAAAKRDLKKACELGNEEACATAKRMWGGAS